MRDNFNLNTENQFTESDEGKWKNHNAVSDLGGNLNYSFQTEDSCEVHIKDRTTTKYSEEDENVPPNSSKESSYQENVDYETAISKTGFGKFNIFLLILALPAVTSSAFDTGSIPYVLPVAKCDLNLNGLDIGLLNSAVYAGMISSSFVWGYLSDTLGRKRLLALGYLLDAFFAILSSTMQNKWAIFVLKYLCGCVISGPFSMFITYISEMFGKKYRDSVILSMGFFTALAGVFQPVFAILVIPNVINVELLGGFLKLNSWRIFIILSAFPALIAGILALFCVESPKFLLSKGRKEEAIEVLRIMYKRNTGQPADTYPVKSLQDEHTEDEDGVNSSNCYQQVSSVFKYPYLKNTLICCGVQFLALNSLNSIRLWLPMLFFYVEAVGKEEMNTCQALSQETVSQTTDCSKITVDQSVYLHVMYTNLANAACMALSSYLVKVLGKKVIIVSSFIISAVLVVTMPWVSTSYIVWVACLYTGMIQVASIAVVGLAVELFPTSVRTLAVSLTMAFGRMGVVLGSVVHPFLLAVSCWTPFTTVGTLCIISASVIFFAVPGRKKQEKPDQSLEVETNLSNLNCKLPTC